MIKEPTERLYVPLAEHHKDIAELEQNKDFAWGLVKMNNETMKEQLAEIAELEAKADAAAGLAEALEVLRNHRIVGGMSAGIRDMAKRDNQPDPIALADTALESYRKAMGG